MPESLDKKCDELFSEWEQYHFSEVRLQDSTVDNTIDLRLDLDDLDKEAALFYEAWYSGEMTEDKASKFENKLSEFRSKLMMNILSDGQIFKP